MLYHSRPKFESGNLLRHLALKALEQQGFDFPSMIFRGFGNGILTGCRVLAAPEKIVMEEGIICFNGETYGVFEPLAVEYAPTDTTCFLRIRMGDPQENSGCIIRQFSLELSEKDTADSGTLELGRFRLQKGAYLRSEYTDFRDRSTLFDTLNIIQSPYATDGGTSLSPEITKAYAREALAVLNVPDFDAMICLSWLQEPFAIPAESIQYYLQRFRCLDHDSNSNEAFFCGLLKRLEQLKEGRFMPEWPGRPGQRKILVD